MTAQESKLQEYTADLQSESGRKFARQMLGREGRDVISVCCMKNDAGNIVSDTDGMKNIWRKYMEKLLNVENDWDGEVDCPEVMGPRCLISEGEVAAAIKGLKIGKAAGPTGVVSEMMKTAGGFGSRWMTDLINNIVMVPTITAYKWWNCQVFRPANCCQHIPPGRFFDGFPDPSQFAALS